mgnify:CR=1 FL=1
MGFTLLDGKLTDKELREILDIEIKKDEQNEKEK